MKRCLLLIAALLLLASVLVGCNPEKATLRKVELNEVTRSVFYAPQYVAVTLGFFEDEGLDVSITSAGGSDKAMTALLSGAADICLAGPETGVYVVNEGKADHPVIVGQITKRDGSFLVSREAEPNFSWENLEGKTIIGGRAGGMPVMTLSYLLKMHGLTPGENVTVIDNIQFNLMGGAFEGGEGDYVTLFEPTATEFQNADKGHIVASVGADSGEIPYTVYLVSQSMLKNDPAFVRSFLRAIYRAQIWLTTATDEEIAEAMQPFFPDSTIESLIIVARSYREIDAWKKEPVMYEEDFNRLLDVMDEAGVLNARPDFNTLIDNTIALEVMGE